MKSCHRTVTGQGLFPPAALSMSENASKPWHGRCHPDANQDLSENNHSGQLISAILNDQIYVLGFKYIFPRLTSNSRRKTPESVSFQKRNGVWNGWRVFVQERHYPLDGGI